MFKPNTMAKRLGDTVKTLQKWDNSGKFKATHSPTNRRYYTQDQYLAYISTKHQPKLRLQVAYARVSNVGQKEHLANQIHFLRRYANGKGLILHTDITDIGSGLNYKRKKTLALLEHDMAGTVTTIFDTYKDRFVRFGYDWFTRLAQKFDTQIVVLLNPHLSPQTTLTTHHISIIHVFSCRLYGLRKYKLLLTHDPSLL